MTYDDKIDAMHREERNPYLFAVPPLEYPVNSVEWLWHDRLHIEDKRNTERLRTYEWKRVARACGGTYYGAGYTC